MKYILKYIVGLMYRFLFRLSFHLKLIPFCNEYGTNRGGSISRYYVDRYVQKHRSQICGRILDFGNKEYGKFLDLSRVSIYDVLDVVSRPEVTIIADIQSCPQVPTATYNAIICTQVLEHVQEPEKALSELYRILVSQGILLLTVPFYGFIHGVPDDFWRFTPNTVRRLVTRQGFKILDFQTAGNAYVSNMYNMGMGLKDVNPAMLSLVGERDPLEVLCLLQKEGS